MLTRLLAWIHLLLLPTPVPPPPAPPKPLTKAQLAAEFPELLRENVLTTSPQWVSHGRALAAQLTLRADLQKRVLSALRASRAEYATAVAVDATTGAVKALLSWQPEKKPAAPLALRASFPAASVFKLVTAAAAVDLHQARPDSIIHFRGGDHELYHFSLKDREGQVRAMGLRQAFAFSVNPVFARLGAEILGGEKLREYAARFGFGEALPADFPVESGQLGLTDTAWGIAETASGYNWRTQMSAVQAAVFSAAIANEGLAMEPYLADTVITADGDVLYRGVSRAWHPLVAASSAPLLRELLRETVRSGTARAAFAGFPKGIEVGGKTGTIQNTTPKGRCDWFAGYAMRDEDKIGFAVLVVHTHPQQAKAAAIARALISAYFNPRALENEHAEDITFRHADFVEIDE